MTSNSNAIQKETALRPSVPNPRVKVNLARGHLRSQVTLENSKNHCVPYYFFSYPFPQHWVQKMKTTRKTSRSLYCSLQCQRCFGYTESNYSRVNLLNDASWGYLKNILLSESITRVLMLQLGG